VRSVPFVVTLIANGSDEIDCLTLIEKTGPGPEVPALALFFRKPVQPAVFGCVFGLNANRPLGQMNA